MYLKFNYIPNKYITVDDKDPALMNETKSKIVCYSDIWKRCNIIPVHKNDKQLVENYQPISLLHIFCKNFLRK